MTRLRRKAINPDDSPPVQRRREVGLLNEGAPAILRCAQDDKPMAVILSAAKDLARTYGESPDSPYDGQKTNQGAYILDVGPFFAYDLVRPA